MINYPMSAPDLRLLLPETLWLEAEQFEQAKQISPRLDGEPQQWQAYLNVLALLAVQSWFQERLPNHAIHRELGKDEAVCTLRIGEFKLCCIAIEHILDEVVFIPKIVIEKPRLTAHFYIVLEVLEDQEQVIIRGFLNHDELVVHHNQLSSVSDGNFFSVPLSAFDAEINHLMVYIHHAEPSAILLPESAISAIATPSPNHTNLIKTRLNQWLRGVLDEGWQALDQLVNPDANLAWSTRQTSLNTKGGKLINFGVQLEHQTVALVVTVTPESEGKIGIGIQALPVGGAQFLPAQLKLSLLSNTDQLLQEVQSREQDNYIQLKPFKGKPGINFSVELSLNDVKVRELFEL